MRFAEKIAPVCVQHDSAVRLSGKLMLQEAAAETRVRFRWYDGDAHLLISEAVRRVVLDNIHSTTCVPTWTA